MDPIETIRIQSMLNVMEGDFLYHYRRICRWYSKTFFTPLHQVMELEEEDVLQAFFESQFEDMTKPARRKMAYEMTETDEELKARKKEEDSHSDDAFFAREAKKAAKEEKKRLKKLAQEAAKAAEKVSKLANSEMLKPKETSKPAPLPEISMNFGPDGNLLDEESIPLPPPRKR